MSVNFSASGAQLARTGTLWNIASFTMRLFFRLDTDTNDYQVMCTMGQDSAFSSNSFEIDAADNGGGGEVPRLGFGNNPDGTVRDTYADTGLGAFITTGTWYVVFVLKNAGTCTFYFAPAETTATLRALNNYTLTYNGTFNEVRFSNSPFGSGYRLRGDLAGVCVWDAQLTVPQMEANRRAMAPVTTSNLWAYWPMATNATAGTDLSGNSRNLTLTGTATTDTDPLFEILDAAAIGTSLAAAETLTLPSGLDDAAAIGTASPQVEVLGLNLIDAAALGTSLAAAETLTHVLLDASPFATSFTDPEVLGLTLADAPGVVTTSPSVEVLGLTLEDASPFSTTSVAAELLTLALMDAAGIGTVDLQVELLTLAVLDAAASATTFPASEALGLVLADAAGLVTAFPGLESLGGVISLDDEAALVSTLVPAEVLTLRLLDSAPFASTFVPDEVLTLRLLDSSPHASTFPGVESLVANFILDASAIVLARAYAEQLGDPAVIVPDIAIRLGGSPRSIAGNLGRSPRSIALTLTRSRH